MNKLFLLGILCSIQFPLWGQDTLLANYPDTDQRWEKIYVDKEKVAENIYYADGSPWMTVKYDTDEMENWKWYYENGNPYFFATILDDKLQGNYRIWYENGQLAERLTFKDHLENGPAVFFHGNGELAATGQYRMGEMIGEWRFYDEAGNAFNGKWEWVFAASMETVRMEGEVKDGTPLGAWTYRQTASEKGKPQKVYQRLF